MNRAAPLASVTFLMLAITASLLPSSTRAQDGGSVSAWISVSSTQPAVGCTVDLAVELRQGGSPAGGSDVLAALSAGGELVSADQATTDDSGIAVLTVDASSGLGDRVDVMVGGTFLSGFAVAAGSGSTCDDGATLLTASGNVPVGTVTTAAEASVAGGVPYFPTIVQQRNLSCEYAALQIATSAWGSPVSEYAFDEVVGWSPNPHWGFRGDINGWWGNTVDYGVYASALAAALPAFGFYGDAFYGGGDSTALTSRLDAGIPVLVWISLWGDQSVVEEFAGATYTVVAGEHVVVAFDYDQYGVWISDPANAGISQIAWGDFMWMWNVLDGMGLGVSPA